MPSAQKAFRRRCSGRQCSAGVASTVHTSSSQVKSGQGLQAMSEEERMEVKDYCGGGMQKERKKE